MNQIKTLFKTLLKIFRLFHQSSAAPRPLSDQAFHRGFDELRQWIRSEVQDSQKFPLIAMNKTISVSELMQILNSAFDYQKSSHLKSSDINRGRFYPLFQKVRCLLVRIICRVFSH